MMDLASKQMGIIYYEDDHLKMLLDDLNLLSKCRSETLGLSYHYKFIIEDDCLKIIQVNQYDYQQSY